MRRILFIVLLVALVAFGFYRWHRLNSLAQNGAPGAKSYTPAVGPPIDPKDVQVLTALDAEYTRLVAAVVPSVVSITSSRTAPVQDPFELFFGKGQAREQLAMGSGVIVSKEGHVLTNHHVVSGMDSLDTRSTRGSDG